MKLPVGLFYLGTTLIPTCALLLSYENVFLDYVFSTDSFRDLVAILHVELVIQRLIANFC